MILECHYLLVTQKIVLQGLLKPLVFKYLKISQI